MITLMRSVGKNMVECPCDYGDRSHCGVMANPVKVAHWRAKSAHCMANPADGIQAQADGIYSELAENKSDGDSGHGENEVGLVTACHCMAKPCHCMSSSVLQSPLFLTLKDPFTNEANPSNFFFARVIDFCFA
jgi:hypothetical protein